MKWKRGAHVRITCGTETLLGMVMLASDNGNSLMLGFDGILDGHVGWMPVLRDDDGTYRSIVNDVEVSIEHARAH